jgi:hypothetical protein
VIDWCCNERDEDSQSAFSLGSELRSDLRRRHDSDPEDDGDDGGYGQGDSGSDDGYEHGDNSQQGSEFNDSDQNQLDDSNGQEGDIEMTEPVDADDEDDDNQWFQANLNN